MKISGNQVSDYSIKTGYWLSLFSLFWLFTGLLRLVSYLSGYRSKATAVYSEGKWNFTSLTTLFGIKVKDLSFSVDEKNVISISRGINGDSSILLQGIILMIYCSIIGIFSIFKGIGASETGFIVRGVIFLVSGIIIDGIFAAIYIFHSKKFGKTEIFEFSNGKNFSINSDQ